MRKVILMLLMMSSIVLAEKEKIKFIDKIAFSVDSVTSNLGEGFGISIAESSASKANIFGVEAGYSTTSSSKVLTVFGKPTNTSSKNETTYYKVGFNIRPRIKSYLLGGIHLGVAYGTETISLTGGRTDSGYDTSKFGLYYGLSINYEPFDDFLITAKFTNYTMLADSNTYGFGVTYLF